MRRETGGFILCHVTYRRITSEIYVALESAYGQVPAITAAEPHPADQAGGEAGSGGDGTAGIRREAARLWDLPNTIRETTSFRTEHVHDGVDEPDGRADPWAAVSGGAGGGAGALHGRNGGERSPARRRSQFTAAHGLTPGQAVTFGREFGSWRRWRTRTTVFINAPFTTTPTAGSAIGPTMTYMLAEDLGSASIFDYWDPSTAVQRILSGAAMDRMQIKVNGDFQEFDFAGPAQDLIDSASFTSGEGGLTAFPAEPAQAGFDYTIVPGHLGQVWMGATPNAILHADGGGADARKQHRAAGAGVRQRFCAVHRGGEAEGDAELQHFREGGCADGGRCIRRRGSGRRSR